MRKLAKQIVKRSYRSMAATAISAKPATTNAVILGMSKRILKEIKQLCSLDRCSLLRDDVEAVKNFSWETVWGEMIQDLPTLVCLLQGLIKRPADHKPLISLIISMILKQRSSKVSLVQRAVSVLLYGNGTSKIVSSIKLFHVTLILTTIATLCVFM